MSPTVARYSSPPGSFSVGRILRSGALKLSLPCSASLATIVAGDALRHRRPAEHRLRSHLLARPGHRLAIAVEEGDAAVLDDRRPPGRPSPASPPAAAGGRRAPHNRRRGGRPSTGWRVANWRAATGEAARLPAPPRSSVTGNRQRADDQREARRGQFMLSFQILPLLPASSGVAGAWLPPQSAKAVRLRRSDQCARRTPLGTGLRVPRLALRAPQRKGEPMQFLKTLFWVVIAVFVAIVRQPKLARRHAEPVGRHAGRHQAPGAARC